MRGTERDPMTTIDSITKSHRGREDAPLHGETDPASGSIMGGRRSTHHPESETSMKSTAVYSLKLVKDRTVRFPISDVNTPTQSALRVHRLIADAPSEHMVVVFLDAKMKVIGTTIAISGHSHGLMVMPKDIFRAALAAHASGIVLGHNHPSGDTTPSK